MDALQKTNIAEAFAYNSESNQAVTGPWQSFAASLADPAFRPILGHAEADVLMTVCHDDSNYVCCLVKIVPGKDPLPKSLLKVIADNRRAEGLQDDDDVPDDDDKENTTTKAQPPCSLYWWEVSKQYDDDGDDDDNFYYLVDSVLPDAEDLELDFMETTLFAIGDDEFDEDDDEEDDPSGFFFDLGL